MSFLKNLFKPAATKTGIVFIIEDNVMYAKTLAIYIKTNFPQIKEVRTFPVGETAMVELDAKPDLIIIDYFLDTRYTDAENGFEIIKQIRTTNPEVNIILLSSQTDVHLAVETIAEYKCCYIQKNDKAFQHVGQIIKEIV